MELNLWGFLALLVAFCALFWIVVGIGYLFTRRKR